MRNSNPLPLWPCSLAVFAAACAAGPSPLDRSLLAPPPELLTAPADVGLAAEPFTLPLAQGASLTGFWLPNAAANGRTVVFCHDEATDAGCVHPYYTFLHAAGLQVLVFDPRGYGQSRGAPTLRTWCQDLAPLLRWLRTRPDVDPQRIALFGTGLGATAARWAAHTQGCAALVLEHLPDAHALAAELGFANADEALGDLDPPAATTASATMPALFLTGDGEPTADRLTLARAFAAHAGPRQLWLLEHTAAPPHGMGTHDGEYQQRLGTFLREALDGAWLRTGDGAVEWRALGGDHYELVAKAGVPEWGNRTALALGLVLADGSAQTLRTWSTDGPREVTLPAPPIAVGVVPVVDAVEDEATGWRRQPTALARAVAALDPLWPRLEALRLAPATPTEVQPLADALAACEASTGQPFPPLVQAELADVFAYLGAALLEHDDPAQRARGRQLLQRAVAATPAQPDQHRWPGPTATYGYPQGEAIDVARELLRAPPR